MKALLIDTSSPGAFLILHEDGEIVSSQILEGAKKLSSTLLPSLDSLLKKLGWKVQDLNYIGVGIGPGSYMGIRTAASVANTLSFGANVPLVPFSSPFAFLPKQEGSFAVIGDGKMGKCFVVTGEKQGTTVRKQEGPFLVEKENTPKNKNFIIAPPYTLNAPWLVQYVHQLYLNDASSSTLELAYLHN